MTLHKLSLSTWHDFFRHYGLISTLFRPQSDAIRHFLDPSGSDLTVPGHFRPVRFRTGKVLNDFFGFSHQFFRRGFKNPYRLLTNSVTFGYEVCKLCVPIRRPCDSERRIGSLVSRRPKLARQKSLGRGSAQSQVATRSKPSQYETIGQVHSAY